MKYVKAVCILVAVVYLIAFVNLGLQLRRSAHAVADHTNATIALKKMAYELDSKYSESMSSSQRQQLEKEFQDRWRAQYEGCRVRLIPVIKDSYPFVLYLTEMDSFTPCTMFYQPVSWPRRFRPEQTRDLSGVNTPARTPNSAEGSSGTEK